MNDTPHPLKRWSRAILAVLESPEDVRTVEVWSNVAALSATQLRANGRLVGIEPKRSLDFARLLRAFLHREDTSWPLEYLLDVSDSSAFYARTALMWSVTSTSAPLPSFNERLSYHRVSQLLLTTFEKERRRAYNALGHLSELAWIRAEDVCEMTAMRRSFQAKYNLNAKC